MDAAERLERISRGYQVSIILLTACKMGVFAALGERTRTAADLAEELGLDARALEIALLALAANGFVEMGEAGFRVAADYAPFLLPDSEQTQSSILNHNYTCMMRWSQLAESLKTGGPAPRSEGGFSPADLRDFICGMADISRQSSVEVAKKMDLSCFRKMLDLGGGPATSSIVFAQRNPNLVCEVFDLEGPIAIAKEEIAKAGLSDRVGTRVADYHKDDFGKGFDLVYISNIIHSLGAEDIETMYGKTFDALEPGGTVILKDFFLEDNRVEPAFAAVFSVNMLVGTEAGRSYTLTETKEMLREAGFGDFIAIEVASASQLLIGRRQE